MFQSFFGDWQKRLEGILKGYPNLTPQYGAFLEPKQAKFKMLKFTFNTENAMRRCLGFLLPFRP